MRGPIELFRASWELFSSNAKLLVGIYLIPAIVTFGYGFFVAFISSSGRGDQFSLLILSSSLLFTAAIIVLSAVSGIGLIKAVSSPHETTVASAYRFGLTHVWSYLWVSVLVGLAVLAGFVLLIIPGIIFTVWFTFSYFILILEGKRGVEAMKASRAYVRGRWWGVFGRLVALMVAFAVFVGVCSIVLNAVFSVSGEALDTILNLLNVVLVPFLIAYTYLLYTDVRTAGMASVQSASSEVPASS